MEIRKCDLLNYLLTYQTTYQLTWVSARDTCVSKKMKFGFKIPTLKMESWEGEKPLKPSLQNWILGFLGGFNPVRESCLTGYKIVFISIGIGIDD